MIIYKCDRCGETMNYPDEVFLDNDAYMKGYKLTRHTLIAGGSKKEKIQLCKGCLRGLHDFVSGKELANDNLHL